jgi:hypothetical protein
MTIVILLPDRTGRAKSPLTSERATPAAAPGRTATKGWIGLTGMRASSGFHGLGC